MVQVLFRTVENQQDVHDILSLQAANHNSAVDEMTRNTQGFVTVRHDFEVLWRMNQAYPSVIARVGDRLAGYCLMMPRSFRADVPILEPMFARLDDLSWHGQPLTHQKWFVMGQVCVAEAYRGIGVFDGMYQHLTEVYRNDFDFVITEVSERNPRSLRTHERVGFQTMYAYNNRITGDGWKVLVLDF